MFCCAEGKGEVDFDVVKVTQTGGDPRWAEEEEEKPVPVVEKAVPPASEGVVSKIRRSASQSSNNSGKSKTSKHSGASRTSKGGAGEFSVVKKWSTIFDGTVNFNGVEPTAKEDERTLLFAGEKPVVVSPARVNEAKGGRPNLLRTTKFTPLTWIPKSLFFQFKRVANIYFLCIAVLVCFSWSPKNWKSKIFPFLFVLLWTALKDLFEDTRRRRDDIAENSQKVKRLTPGSGQDVQFEEVNWSDVLCGDVLYIPDNAAFPADLLLLHPAGGVEAFISTVMLDGETSLKVRMPPGICEVLAKKCAKQAPDEWAAAQTVLPNKGVPFPFRKVEEQILKFMNVLRKPGMDIKYSPPTPVLSDVRGTLVPCGSQGDQRLVCPFSEENFLPRGCVLRNTPWVLAAVVYVGDDTKARLNADSSSMKTSNMQILLNMCIRIQLVVLMAICLYATIMAFTAGKDYPLAVEAAHNPVIRFFMFCITFYHVVPMSLYVVYEMLKLVLAFQVNTDKQMEDPVTHLYATARTAEVMEEMGQVNFVFSDKTGTLTANEMIFARCHIGGEDMGDFRTRLAPEGQEPAGALKVKRILAAPADPLHKQVLDFFTCLGVCHSVQAAKVEGQEGRVYSGSSPDEVALCDIARDMGVVFLSRARQHGGLTSELLLAGPGSLERSYIHLQELAFSSDRKRMSVLVKHQDSYLLITKGADSVMEPLLTEPFSQACSRDLAAFSGQGLRTLIVAMKVVPKDQFDAWNKEYMAARNSIEDTKEDKLAELAARLERGLQFVGLTAVEDRLQDGVPDTIRLVKEMGIRLWVLTGDKTETAIDIARSCLLFQDTTHLATVLKANSIKEAEDLLLKAHSELDGKTDGGLVLDGQTLLFALNSLECRKLIYELGVVSRSCVCSRLSPMQKLELVRLVREQNKKAITLAIGDGANDVPMIQGAHVGIAIRGKEGTQSVQASDIAISQFRFLAVLLMCHGRRAYRRVSVFLSYYLYKNVALLMCDICWMHQDHFRARIALPEYLSIGFNVFFSAWHILFVLGFDKDISDQVAMTKPELYKVGPARALFNARIFAKWMFYGILHGCIAWLVPNLWFGGSDYDKRHPGIFWVGSATSFTCVNIIVWIKLLLSVERPWAPLTLLATAGAVLCYVVCLALIGYWSVGIAFQPCMEKVPQEIVRGKALQSLFIVPAVALAIDLLEKVGTFFVCPSTLQVVRRGW